MQKLMPKRISVNFPVDTRKDLPRLEDLPPTHQPFAYGELRRSLPDNGSDIYTMVTRRGGKEWGQDHIAAFLSAFKISSLQGNHRWFHLAFALHGAYEEFTLYDALNSGDVYKIKGGKRIFVGKLDAGEIRVVHLSAAVFREFISMDHAALDADTDINVEMIAASTEEEMEQWRRIRDRRRQLIEIRKALRHFE